jgi:16S rRNA processing protein RimM
MDYLVAGKVRTSHGVQGFVKVHSISGETEHFMALSHVVLRRDGREREFAIESVKPSGRDGLLMKLEGIESPEEGKKWAGAEIVVPREAAAKKGEGEYYCSELIGCALMARGDEVGKVVSIVENGISDLLEVDTPAGRKIVPFQAVFIGKVDIEAGEVELLEPGLLE